MKTQNEHEISEDRVRGLQRQNSILKWIAGIEAIVIIILIILWALCCNKNSQLRNENAELKSRNDLIAMRLDSSEKRTDDVEESNLALWANLDSTNARVSELEDCCEKSQKTIKRLESENKKVRTIIDSLQNVLVPQEYPIPVLQGPMCTPEEDTFAADTVVAVKHLNFQVVKTSFHKENSEQKVVLNYDSQITFSSLTGFSRDNMDYVYPYVNENGDSSDFEFQSMILGNNVSFNINQNKNLLLSENKEFSLPFEVGGLQVYGKESLVDLNWTSQIFLERTFDPKRFKRGQWECIVGPILAGAGGFGVGYYAFNPMVEVNVYKGDKLVGTDKTYNVPMIITSGAVFLAGVGLTIEGCLNKKLSYSLNPTEFSVKYLIE